MSLRKNFKKLPEATKAEFTERLTLGVEKRYWTVIKGAELDKLRRLEGGGHFLPANYVLKDPAGTSSTKARLMLDPLQVFNGTLLTPVNVENKIGDVLRCQQALTIIGTQDIHKAFFRLRLSPAAKKIVFIMDMNSQGELTADDTPGTRLVAVSVDVSVMGINQTPLLLALVLPKELEALQQ